MTSAEKNKLVKLLSFAVLDDEGNHLNPSTVITDLKSANVKKRPGM